MSESAPSNLEPEAARGPTPTRSNSIPFPSDSGDQRLKGGHPALLRPEPTFNAGYYHPESHSSSSNLTSSDKLTALPSQSTPVLDRLKTITRGGRRSTDASLTSIDSASGSLHALHSLPDAVRQSESDSSVAKDTPRPRNESGRSLPGSFQNARPGEFFASLPPWLSLLLSFFLRLPFPLSAVGGPVFTRRNGVVSRYWYCDGEMSE